MAQFAASHALLLLAGAILLCSALAALVLALVHVALRHADRLWSAVDAFVPGRIWRPRTYLLGHLLLGFVLILSLLGFIALAQGVTANRRVVAFDLAFAEALGREVSAPWRGVFAVFHFLGSYVPVTAIAVAVMWRLLSRGRRLLGILWGVSQAGGLAISETLKVTFARSRPEGADPLFFATFSASFPSGHALASVVLCGVGAYLLLRTIRAWHTRVLLVSGALAWSLAMGFSRLYLGVHYVSDVAAGFLVGTAWVAVCISGMEIALRGRKG